MLGLVLLTLLPGQFPVIESTEFPAKLQQTALAGTVYIHNRSTNSDGTGVIIRVEGVSVYILTAGHVIKDAADPDIAVATFAPDKFPKPQHILRNVKILAQSQGVKDLALLRVVTGEKVGPAIPLYPPPREPKRVKTVLTVGCNNGQPPTCQVEKIMRAALFSREANGEKAKLWEVQLPQIPGRSGGPMLDDKGRLIGICSGNNRGEHGYFCHIGEIETFLQALPAERFLLREPAVKEEKK